LIAAEVGPRLDSAASRSLVGKVLVLTGTLPTLTRAEATARIESAGGSVAANVTKHTHYVVAGRGPGSKLDRARLLQVEVLDEAALMRLLGD
jgi:DNA ligase (NAD+)